MNGKWVRRRINWSWVMQRLAVWRCRHEWMVGSKADGKQACRKCGTWRWFPITGGVWL